MSAGTGTATGGKFLPTTNTKTKTKMKEPDNSSDEPVAPAPACSACGGTHGADCVCNTPAWSEIRYAPRDACILILGITTCGQHFYGKGTLDPRDGTLYHDCPTEATHWMPLPPLPNE